MRVHVVVSQGQACADNALGRIGDFDVIEQELVDGTGRLATFPELLDVGEDLGIVGCVGAHGVQCWEGHWDTMWWCKGEG